MRDKGQWEMKLVRDKGQWELKLVRDEEFLSDSECVIS